MKQILVVDHEPVLRDLLRQLLAPAGYEVSEAADGESAVRLFRQNSPDLVIIEPVLPGKNGLEVIRELRRDCPEARFVALSSLREKRELARQCGALAAFAKPFDLSQLLEAIQALLEPKHHGGSPAEERRDIAAGMKEAYEPDEREKAFLAGLKHDLLGLRCIQYALAINVQCPDLVMAYVAEDAHVNSQSGTSVASGYRVGANLDNLCEHSRILGPSRLTRAEVTFQPDSQEPCVLLHRRYTAYGRPGLGEPILYSILETNEAGRINHVFEVTCVPEPETCTRTGLFPGISASQIRQELDFRGPTLPKDAEITFRLVVLSCGGIMDMMQDSVKEVCESYPRAAIETITVEETEAGMQECRKNAVVAFPTLIVMVASEVVYRVHGYLPADLLARNLREIFV